MSGNPFRRTTATRLPDEESHVSILPTPSAKPRTKTPKKVRITSPPHSPPISNFPPDSEYLPGQADGRTPLAPLQDGDEDEHMTNGHAEIDQDMLWSNEMNAAASFQQAAPAAGRHAPYNPFARTLATSEATFGLQTTNRSREEPGPSGANKGLLDVDAFKNLLLTGQATPSVLFNDGASGMPPQRVPDNGTSTDTSSLSAQSMFESVQLQSPSSPGTSFDHNSMSDDDGSHDDEASLMGAGRIEQMPPVPKHKHGKAMSRGPQTVSFADFDEQIPEPTGFGLPDIRASSRSPIGGILRQERPGASRSASDLNKPLPPPPPATGSPEPVPDLPEKDPIAATMETQNVEASDVPTPKKKPPPPPASRRQSPMAFNNALTRTRSGSNLTQISVPEEDELELVAPSAESTPKAAPPPPPARRTNAAPSPSPAAPYASDTASIASSTGESASTPKAPTMPPPPPRRSIAKALPTQINRTPSNASKDSVTSTGGGNMPPAPPTRRRAGSNRSSVELTGGSRRSSGGGSQRTASFSSLQPVAGGLDESEGGVADGTMATDQAPLPPPAPTRDILADIEALQREVDAMRAKAGINS